MDTFILPINPNHLGVCNYKRIDDYTLLESVLKCLNNSRRVCLGDKQIMPSEDMWEGIIDGNPFTLFFDISYLDIDFHANSPQTLELLANLLKQSPSP